MLARDLPLLGALWFSLGAPALAQHPAPPPRADYSGQAFVIERIHEQVRFQDDGTGTTALDARVRVQTDAALQAFGELTIPYSAANQRLDIDTVRVHKVGGGVVIAPASAVQDVTAPLAREAPIYSDLREKIVTVPGLRPGDTLEYHLTWTTHTPLAPGQFWFTYSPFRHDAIVLDGAISLVVPRSRLVHVKTTGAAEPKVSEAGTERSYVWRYSNLQVDTATDTARPGAVEREPARLRVSTFRTWEEVGRWYAGLERERETVTPEVRAKADSLVRGRSTFRDSVAALYDYVANGIRYVSLSFGLGRYQPHAASDVLANQYGDCKDKHTLLAALLRAVGVVSAPVLISSDHNLDPDMASPDQFDHLISYVSTATDTLWLDATPTGAPLGFLWFPLRNKRTLVMPLDGTPAVMRTPAAPPFATFQRVQVQGTLDELGKMTLAHRFALRGDGEVVAREVLLRVPPERWSVFADGFVREGGLSGTVSGFHASDPVATGKPFEMSFQLASSASLTWKDRRADLRVPLLKVDLPVDDDDTTAARDTTIVGALQEESASLKLALPRGTTARLPVPVALTRDYATYHSSYRLDSGVVSVERVLHWERRDLPPARGADVRAFARAIREDERQVLQLARAAGDQELPASAGAAELYKAGTDALNTGDARTAVRLLGQVVRLEPQHQFAWNNLGRAYARIGRFDSAMVAYRQQIAVNPYDQYAYNNLGLAEWQLRHYEDAAGLFRKQIEVSPLDDNAHANLGRLDVELHRDSDAVVELEKAVSIKGNDPFLRVDLGKAYLTTHRPDQATAEFDRAVELAPAPPVWNNVAYALAQQGTRLDQAERYARSAIDATAAVLRGVTLEHVGFRESSAVVSIGTYWDTLGWIYLQRGDTTAAERYVRAAWLLNHHGEVGDHLAQIYERRGRKQEAIHTYALALNGTRPPPDTRARLAALAGGPAEADRLAEQARPELTVLRTVQLGTTLKSDVTSEVQVLLTPGHVEDVRFINGPSQVRHLEEAIRRASFPVVFPDSASIKLPRRALLTCWASSGACTLVLIEPEMGSSFGPAAPSRQLVPRP